MKANRSATVNRPTPLNSATLKTYLLFTLCASLYLLPFMRIIFVARDEGSLLIGAVRIVHGQVFARDFFEAMGPGSFYWLALFFKTFGVTFVASRICLFISSLGIALSIFFLSRRVCKQNQLLPCIILAAVSFGGVWPGISHHVDSNFFALLAVVCLVFWNSSRKNILLIAAGSLAGITTCVLQPKGVLLFCAILAWVWFQGRKVSSPRFLAGLVLAGFAVVVGLMLAYFWSQGALSDLVYTNFTFPHQHYAGVNKVIYANGLRMYYWDMWTKAFGGGAWSVMVTAILIAPLAFVAILPLVMLLVGIRYKKKRITPEIALYLLCGLALWFSEFHRPDIWHLVLGAPLLIILFIVALSESSRKSAQAALAVLSVTSICLASFNCCVVLAMGMHQSKTRVGNAATAGIGTDQVLEFISAHISPGEEMLVYPYCPTYYFLSKTTNPTHYSFLMYDYNTPAQFREVIDVLERRRIRYVIWETTFAANAAKYFSRPRPASPDSLIMEAYLKSHYRVVEDDQGILIMERKVEPLANQK